MCLFLTDVARRSSDVLTVLNSSEQEQGSWTGLLTKLFNTAFARRPPDVRNVQHRQPRRRAATATFSETPLKSRLSSGVFYSSVLFSLFRHFRAFPGISQNVAEVPKGLKSWGKQS